MINYSVLKNITSTINTTDEFVLNNSIFYELLYDKNRPQPRPRSIGKINNPKGTIFSHENNQYMAPHDGIPLLEPMNKVSELEINEEHQWYRYINEIRPNSGNKRLTYGAHGNIGFISIDDKMYTATEFKRHADDLLIDKGPISEIRLLSCCSANGGKNSLAAEVSNIIGLPTTGFKGSVTTSDIHTLSLFEREGVLRSEKHGGSLLGPRNFQRVSGSKPPIPSALSKQFNPTFGAPGFDDMPSFFEGIFIV